MRGVIGLVGLMECTKIAGSAQKLFLPANMTLRAASGGYTLMPMTGRRKHFGCGCMMGAMQTRTIMTSLSLPNAGGEPMIAPAPVKVPDPGNVVDYIESIQQTGKAAVLFSDAPPVLWAVDMLCLLKDLPGMTWISTIICGTIVIRAAVGLPVAIIQQKAIGRLENLKPELQKLAEELKRETAAAIRMFKWDERTTQIQYKKSFKKHWRKIMEDNNCHPMRSLALSFIQLPFWICFSSALRNAVYAVPLPRTPERIERWIQIHNESTPWLESLVLPDPIVLPAIFLGTSLLNIEFARRLRLKAAIPETKLQKIVPWILRGVIVAIAILSTSVPSAVSMYWATSSSIALAQNVFLRSGTARKLFKLPTISTSNLTAASQPPSKSIGKVL